MVTKPKLKMAALSSYAAKSGDFAERESCFNKVN